MAAPPIRRERRDGRMFLKFVIYPSRLRRFEKNPCLSFPADFSVHHGFQHFEIRIQNDDVRQITGLQSTQILQTESAGLIPGGGLDQIGKRHAGNLGDVPEGIADLERAAGESAVGRQTGGAVTDDDGKTAQRVVAVGHSAGPHGVGDQLDAVASLEFEDQIDHIRTDVKLIADQLDIYVVAGEPGADQTDIPMMKRRHLIAEVAQVSQAVIMGGQELLERGGAVNTGGRDPFGKQLRREFRGAGHLHGIGDLADREDFRQTFDLFDIRRTDKVRVLRPDEFRIDVGPFQMDARDPA